MSRNPVRESIRALEATGLIEVVPRRGAYVAEIDHTDLGQLLEVRQILEAHGAALAARNRTDDVIARLLEKAPFDQLQLQRLKKRKLMLKDEISRLESRLLPDIIA